MYSQTIYILTIQRNCIVNENKNHLEENKIEKKLINQYVGAVITEKTNKTMLKNKGNYGLMALAAGFLDLLDNHYVTLGDKN